MDLTNFGYWLFSTSVQAMAALFAVVGVFIVFKIQILVQRSHHLVKIAKSAYIDIQKISAGSDLYRNIEASTSEEIITKFKELIKKERESLNRNKEKVEERRKQQQDIFPFNNNVKSIENKISNCKIRLRSIQDIDQDLKYIKRKGVSSLTKISWVFGLSLVSLFLTHFIGTWLIFILSLIIVVITMFIIIQLVNIVIESLK